ncbi:MAG: GNAT family N-acetyltransferase [Anaerolineae bacterium]|nr:GNAT family N-acetyltransferase [Anaerolineae bacterium]
MQSSMLHSENDIQAIREFITRLAPHCTLADFDEQMLLPTVKVTVRIFTDAHKMVGFAYVDDYYNLWFETDANYPCLRELERQIIAWGSACIDKRNQETGEANTLDCSCRTEDARRIHLLERHGFVQQPTRTRRYLHPLDLPIITYPLPDGFSIRCVQGDDEVQSLVSLHQAAFGTDNMTVAQRLAMMHTPHYLSAMDLVVVAPNGKLAAFCVCGFDDLDKKVGYTDPIGVHPHYQGLGLAKAVISAGLLMLQNAGAIRVELGTSSDNVAMQKLAEKSGFVCTSEKLWFSKHIT